VSAAEIDAYLAGVDEPHRSTLESLRRAILAVVPDAEQGISYDLPAFRVDGIVVAGFGAYRRHVSYFPHSGSVLAELAGELDGYDWSKGTLRFAPGSPLPRGLVRRLVTTRLRQARERGR
jgi:uncharacterized protein YdhG (YjbR/CyaY superfamily)